VIVNPGAVGHVAWVQTLPAAVCMLYGAVGIYLASCVLFLVQSRYRTPAVPFLSLFAGSAIFITSGDGISAQTWQAVPLNSGMCGHSIFLSQKRSELKFHSMTAGR
jgi:hypothetical protein